MAGLARAGTGNVVFVVALGVSALGHVAVLAGRADTEPHPIGESASGWNGDEDAVQIFDAPLAAEEPATSVTPSPEVHGPEDTSRTVLQRAEPRIDTPPVTRKGNSAAASTVAKPMVANAKGAPPTKATSTDSPEATTPGTAPVDEAQPPVTDEKASSNPHGETEIEAGVIRPRESWGAPPEKPHAPPVSGMPTPSSPEPPATPDEVRLAPGVARLETAFTRSVPYYNYADPAWEELPLGRVGSMQLVFVVDASGQILEATARESPSPVLERLRRRTLFGLRRGHFAIQKAQVTAGRRTLRIDVFLEQRPVGSQALPAMSFRAPTNGRPGVATMHLESGRFVTVQVLPVDD